MNDAGWKSGYLTCADVAMLGHRCGVSQYIQFHDQQLENFNFYHVHIWEVLRVTMEKNNIRKMVIRLGR